MKTSRSEEASTDAPGETTEAPDAGEPAVLEIALLPAETPAEAAAPSAAPARIDGVVVGRLLDAGEPRVSFPGAPEGGVAARSMIELAPADRGAEVALMFERGDPAKPTVLGKMAQGFAGAKTDRSVEGTVTVTREGERLVLSAEEEIVLRCGEASITLTRAGKVLLKGAYVSSRSTGVNRIQGGSVEIN